MGSGAVARIWIPNNLEYIKSNSSKIEIVLSMLFRQGASTVEQVWWQTILFLYFLKIWNNYSIFFRFSSCFILSKSVFILSDISILITVCVGMHIADKLLRIEKISGSFCLKSIIKPLKFRSSFLGCSYLFSVDFYLEYQVVCRAL